MRRQHVASLVAALFATSSFALAAQTTAASAEVAVDAQSADTALDQKTQPEIDRLCPRNTGTRIVAREDRKKDCNAFGRVYTSEDIQRTGAFDLADALRKLDPAIR